MNINSKGFAHLFLLIVLALVVVGGIGYYTYKNGQIRLTPQQDQPPPTPTKTVSPTISESSFCNCSWAISSTTNVEFLVTNPSGKQTGYLQATKGYIQDIPDSSYGIEGGISDDTGQSTPSPSYLYFGQNIPENGNYVLQVIPKQVGNYHLEISFAWGPGNTKVSSFDGTLISNQIDKYTITIPDGSNQKLNE